MKNTQTNTTSAKGGVDEQENYFAPPPPSKGRIYAIDQHPDVNVVAIVKGSTPHDMRTEKIKGDLTLEQLVAWLGEVAQPHDMILVEAGNGCFELSRRLGDVGLSCCVLESSWVGAQADKYVDNDKLAAVRIARVYLQGNAKAVWQPDQSTIEKRQLLHLHIKAKQARTKAINSLRCFLTNYGIRPGSKTLSNARNQIWIRNSKTWTARESFTLEDLIDDVNYTTQRSRNIERRIAAEITLDKKMLSLMSLLGIGMINAFALMATIGDIHRFKTPKKLVAYMGLNPNQKTSGKGKNKTTGAGNRGRKDIRTLLTQGAQAVLRQGSRTLLGKWGMSLMLRKGHRNIAVAAIARKMAMQVWHLLMGNKAEWLEPTKSRSTKFTKMLSTLGKAARETLRLPATSKECINHFNLILEPINPDIMIKSS